MEPESGPMSNKFYLRFIKECIILFDFKLFID